MHISSKVWVHAIKALHVLISACLSVVLVYASNWAVNRPGGADFLNDWAFFHGGFLVVFPVFAFYWWLTYTLLRPIVCRLQVTYLPENGIPSRGISVLAVLSLSAAISAFIIPLFGSIVAVILGHIARRHCRQRPALRGYRLALAGLILGYFGIFSGGMFFLTIMSM